MTLTFDNDRSTGRVVFVQTLFRPLQHLGVPHSPLPPRDETKTQNSMHAPPYDFRGELVPIYNRKRRKSARSCVYSVNEWLVLTLRRRDRTRTG